MLAVIDEVVGPDMIALLRSPVDGSPQVVIRRNHPMAP
jgi:hypothetical protein